MKKVSKVLFFNIALIVVFLAAFDVFAFFFIPQDYIAPLREYRYTVRPNAAGRLAYPEGYFVEHKDRGFDIGADKSGQHWVPGVIYPVWSNGLGCFDDELQAPESYVYFAGDSFLWGYVPNEQHFATLTEEESGRTVLKCGVTHTGQRHQYAKLLEIIDKVGKAPQEIFVFHYLNDVANDYAYPHSTVVRGWLIDDVMVDQNDRLVRLTRPELEQRVDTKLKEIALAETDFVALAKKYAKYYSLSTNIAVYLKDLVVAEFGRWKVLSTAGQDTQSLEMIYTLPNEKDGRYWYGDNPQARPNQEAMLDFKRLAAEREIRLVVVLIPHKRNATNPEWYTELRAFLAANEIEHIDLAEAFSEKEIDVETHYWPADGHFNAVGNSLVAEILLDAFPDIFDRGEGTADSGHSEDSGVQN